MNYAALKSEVAKPEYAGMSDAQIAAALNATTVETIRDVPTSEARALLLSTGEWGGIVMLARATPSETIPAEAVAAAITAEDTLRLTVTLELTRDAYWQAVQTLLGGLVAAGVLSAGTRAALLALRETTTSRAAQLGWSEIRTTDIETARQV
jgi:hypothetical protein